MGVGGFDLDAYITTHTEQINACLETLTPRAELPPQTLHTAMRYSLFARGKRVRPLLCLAGAEAVGGNSITVLPMACAVEMIHTFSLIHDDLPALDNDTLRRGLPTSHVKFGEALAILAGDALHTLAFAVIAREQSGPPARVLKVIQLLAEACGESGMVGGQVDDMAWERRSDITLSTLRSIHARKTGALLTASIVSGAILAGASPAEEQALTQFGNSVGVAFQIVDDILDVTGTDESLGKPAGSDLKNDKATYPKLVGLDESKRLARAAEQEALAALDIFGASAEPLRQIARFIVERNT
jgi:geranylgeranyl diphosphate synthase, type II